jgi:hypothetical protein
VLSDHDSICVEDRIHLCYRGRIWSSYQSSGQTATLQERVGFCSYRDEFEHFRSSYIRFILEPLHRVKEQEDRRMADRPETCTVAEGQTPSAFIETLEKAYVQIGSGQAPALLV